MIAMTDTSPKLALEIRDQGNETVSIAAGSGLVQMPPLLDDDYWSYRVRLSDTQAVLGFPKFSTVGIGFAVEDDGYNTNLPYHCPTDQILAHIIDNKGDGTISDADVREAIRMIQLAVIDERAAARREFFSEAARVARTRPTTVPGQLFDQLLDDQEATRNEHVMLRAEVEHLRTANAARELPGGGQPFAALLLRVGVPTKDGRILSADGKIELPADAPILRVVDAEITYSPSDIVGRIVGLWRAGSDIYAVGVADPEIADALNLGELMLGADMDADVAGPPAQGESLPTVITFTSGRVTAARVRAPEAFAWEI